MADRPEVGSPDFDSYDFRSNDFRSYDEFFAYYVRQHSVPANRAMHAIGTVLGPSVAIAAFVFGHPWFALLWPVVGYGCAWTGHYLLEHNTPATFGHPWWSFISDFRMVALMGTGRLTRWLDGDYPGRTDKPFDSAERQQRDGSSFSK